METQNCKSDTALFSIMWYKEVDCEATQEKYREVTKWVQIAQCRVEICWKQTWVFVQNIMFL
jgi:hypothetical protein